MKALALFGILLILLVSGCVQETQADADSDANTTIVETAETISEDAVTDSSGQLTFEELEGLVSREFRYEESRRPHRNEYGIPSEVFEKLPEYPDDFGTMTYLFQTGRIQNIDLYEEEYYKQPEFYPRFNESGLRWWTDPDPTSWATSGFGAYPGDIWVATFPGAEFTAKTFWHTSWGVQTYQGFQMVPAFPATSEDPNGIFNQQDPEEVSKYFDVSFEPNVFLMEPTYPQFKEGWAKLLKMKVKVHENTPKGQYVVAARIINPPEEKHDEWILQYKAIYFDAASSGFTLSRPHWRLIITVD